jgi:putative colanic acid biosynthesis UDP-glucose lipid carrier transferase
LDRQFILPDEDCSSSHLEDFVANVAHYVRGSPIDEIILGLRADRWSDLSKLLSGLRILPLPVSLIPVGAAADILRRPTHVLGDSICVELHHGPLSRFEQGVKRVIDLLGASAGLVLLMPLLLATAILIKLDSPGPILFRQKRCGFNGRIFNIYKFRTMSVLEDGPSICQAAKNDCRITRVGKWLRRTSIDELPQLLNVLTGTMSLVGPRPHAVAHDTQFDKVVRNYAFRHNVKPGLTGWAQVHGQRGPTPAVADIQRRVQFDLWYIDNWSLRLDFMIIIRTFGELMRGHNAY